MLIRTKRSAPSAPSANKVAEYVDTADRRTKSIDENGLISTLNNIGPMDENTLYNGSFGISQRVNVNNTAITGLSTSTRAGQVSDRWAVTASVASNLTWATTDAGSTGETGLLARYYGNLEATSAGKKVMVSQFIINQDMAHLRDQKVRLSVKLNQKVGSGQTYRLGLLYLTASGTIDVCPTFLTGAWSTTTGVDPAWGTNLTVIAPDASPSGENCTVGASWASITSVSATWQRSSAVFTIPSTAKNLVVVLFSDATGGATDRLAISEFQLTQGPDIVDWVQPHFGLELLKCQRFFCKSFPYAVVPAASLSEATAGSGCTGILGKSGSGTALGSAITIQFPVQLWKSPPNITLFTPIGAGAVVYRITGTTPAVQGATTVRSNSNTDRGFVVTATNEATTNGAVGDLIGIHYIADVDFSN